jgi:hypothetical protein
MVGYLLKKNKVISILYLIFLLLFFTQNVYRVLGDESEAVSSISHAEDSLKAAYLSVLEAERAGVDISEVVVLLNNALTYFSEAERALKSGQHDTAVQLAGKAAEVSNAVLEANINLIFVAGHVEEEAFRNQLFLSSALVCLVVMFGFLGWRRFKVYYVSRVMDVRPEVVVDES